jgi:hypothetical protein
MWNGEKIKVYLGDRDDFIAKPACAFPQYFVR